MKDIKNIMLENLDYIKDEIENRFDYKLANYHNFMTIIDNVNSLTVNVIMKDKVLNLLNDNLDEIVNSIENQEIENIYEIPDVLFNIGNTEKYLKCEERVAIQEIFAYKTFDGFLDIMREYDTDNIFDIHYVVMKDVLNSELDIVSLEHYTKSIDDKHLLKVVYGVLENNDYILNDKHKEKFENLLKESKVETQ